MPAVAIGQTIGSYRITRQIGAGGMGAVYEAAHTVLAHRAAVKVLISDFQAQPNLVLRFNNEARAASQINHPGIVRVYDLGLLEDGQPWLAMEYLDGQSLADRIRAGQRMPGRCLGIDHFWVIGDIASALAAAHQQGIIHRDLKPANIMVVPDPATLTGERAKVVDFGIAKLHGDNLTHKGAILGTPLYMALEQFRDSGEVDGKADCFSLGVIAYQILTGRLPHNGPHFAVMGARLMEPIPPIQQFAPTIPADVAALVMRMLEREPTSRPAMAEVESEVRKLLGLPARQSGWHPAVIARGENATPSDPAGLSFGETASGSHSSLQLTPDLPLSSDSQSAQPPTPSSEKAAGEISPRDIPVPQSLSSMPSVPIGRGENLRAGPEDRTVPPAPTQLVPESFASPSAPTFPKPPRRALDYRLGAIAGVFVLIAAAVAFWTRQLPTTQTEHPSTVSGATAPPAPVSIAPPPVTRVEQMPEQVVPSAGEPTPSTQAPTESVAVEQTKAEDKSPPGLVSTPNTHRHSEAKPATARASARCTPVTLTESCIGIKGRSASADLKGRILKALRDSRIRLCAGERLLIGTGDAGARLLDGPDRLSSAPMKDFLIILGGYLDDNSRIGQIEISCTPH